MTTASEEKSKESFFDGRWLRRASDIETYFDDNTFHLCYILRLKSKSPLRENHVRAALAHLYRKCPSLNVCFGNRDGTRWIRRTLNPNIDFQVIKDQRIEEVRNNLLNFKFNEETGPLFAARLVENVTDFVECPDEPEDLAFHTSYVLFALSHALGDGVSFSIVMGFFVNLLDDVISGKPICDDEPLGEMLPSDYLEEEIRKKMELLKNDPVLQAKATQETDKLEKDIAFMKTAFPTPNRGRNTFVETFLLDQETTANFRIRCKQEGVTFNSGFSAAVNLAFTDLLLENGIEQDYFTLKFYALISFRRYSKTDISNCLGAHSGYPFAMSMQVPRKLDNQKHFWEHARSFHEEFSHIVQSGKAILRQASQTLLYQDKPVPLLDDDKSTFTDFATSNIGDVTSSVTKGGEEVRPTHFFRAVAMHSILSCPMNILNHTFRGRFTLCMCYNTAVIETDTMKRFGNQIIKRIRSALE